MKYLSTMFAIYNLLDMTDLVAKPNVVIQLPYKLAGKPLVQHITQCMERHNTTISWLTSLSNIITERGNIAYTQETAMSPKYCKTEFEFEYNTDRLNSKGSYWFSCKV